MKSSDGFLLKETTRPQAMQRAFTDALHTYDEIIAFYNENGCWGLQANIDVKECNPILIRSSDVIKKYAIELCDLIKMKRFGETTVVNFGEDEKVAGYSMVQLIETSLISGHFANQTNNAYIDVFSCKLFDPYQAAEFTQIFFDARSSIVNFVFR